jgi:hypothetical protein
LARNTGASGYALIKETVQLGPPLDEIDFRLITAIRLTHNLIAVFYGRASFIGTFIPTNTRIKQIAAVRTIAIIDSVIC